MDIRKIRTFVHIAELGSYSRAAGFLHVSQPALSRQMRLLEEELSLTLFYRHGHGVELTNQGLAFLDRCRDVLTDFEQLRLDFQSRGTNTAAMGSVSIGLPVPATRFATPRLLEAATKAYPGLSVRFVEGFSTLLNEWLLSGSLDLAILFEPRATRILTSKPLLSEDLFAIVSASSPHRNRKFFDARELRSTTLILPHRPHILRDLVDSLHFGEVDVMEVDSTSLMVELARVGKGITILPQGSVDLPVRAGDVLALPIINPTLSWQVSVSYSNVRPLTLGARVMLDLMRKEIGSKVASGEWASSRLIRPNMDLTDMMTEHHDKI
jgi:LysR family transcriptional regulator, nitrogen assimilation regulatory protein